MSFTLSDLLSNALNISLPEMEISLSVIDSREVIPGSLFFALEGVKTDGHIYLEEVRSRGAVAAVVRKDYDGEDFGLYLVRVENTLEALQKAAKHRVVKMGAKIVGITGSCGKTTTKDFLATLLEPLGTVWKSPGSANSQAGLPIHLLNAYEAEYLVLEMGMNHEGEIAKLIQIAMPDVVAITNIGIGHAEFFEEGQIGIAKAKGEILEGMPKAYMNEQVALFAPFKDYEPKVVMGDPWRLQLEMSFELPFTESHFMENFALASMLAKEMGVSVEDLKTQALKLKLPEKRFEKQVLQGITFINDSYNANPMSVLAALRNLPKGNRVLFAMGSMKELGKFSEESHVEIAKEAAIRCDLVMCYGMETRVAHETLESDGITSHYCESFERLSEVLKKEAREGDVVLIKGSKSLSLWRLLELFA